MTNRAVFVFFIFCLIGFAHTAPECSRQNPCSDGSCCSKWGFCGTTDEFCGKGCLSNCHSTGVEFDTGCSRTRPCEDGSCCSKWGFCGTDLEHCGKGCQSNCLGGSGGPSNSHPSPKAEIPGGAECSKFVPCSDGSCCSKWGFCGTDLEHCGKGCQSNCLGGSGGPSNTHPSPKAEIPGGAECSKFVPCSDGSCCSKWGFCGTDLEHCGKGCQSNCLLGSMDSSRTHREPDVELTGQAECSRLIPCSDGSCCSKWGFCGSDLEHCGEGCQSNCPTKPGQSKPKDPSCSKHRPCENPEDCCSKWGFCGTGEEFCGAGCQANCWGGYDDYEKSAEISDQFCSKENPCSDGTCCSKWGFCGDTEEHCGEGCQSNCHPSNGKTEVRVPLASSSENASTIECGRFSSEEYCPLNICCSQFGYCGMTPEFCRSGCQSNCVAPRQATCSRSKKVIKRYIGYYAGWALDPKLRRCGIVEPETINADTYTHIIYAFATIQNNKLALTRRDKRSLARLVRLKSKNPDLKIMVAVGGWAFNDKPTQDVFTTMASRPSSRRIFARSVMATMEDLKLDGIDIDWEYPVVEERGGQLEDRTNYVLLLREIRRLFASDYSLSVASPASYWYLKHFDLVSIGKFVDFLNVMTYDLHGVWDSYRQPYVFSHTNLTEIKSALEIYYRAGISPSQLNLGLAFYARTFRLASRLCSLPGCFFLDGGKAGGCTLNEGSLSYFEVDELLRHQPSLQPKLDMESASMLLSYDRQWIGYEDATTLKLKMNFALKECMGGLMVWSIDQDSEDLALQEAIRHWRYPPSNSRRNMYYWPSLTGRRPYFSRFLFPMSW